MSIQKDETSYIIEPYTVLSYDARKADGELPIIKIGKKCSIAMNCMFLVCNHMTDVFCTHPSDRMLFSHNKGNISGYSKGDIIIKNDVWIGANSILVDGITIGNGAVVAAGSVVTKDVPPYAIVGGNPAKVIKYRFSKEFIAEIEATGFWDMDISEINKFDIYTKDVHELLEKIKQYRAQNA